MEQRKPDFHLLQPAPHKLENAQSQIFSCEAIEFLDKIFTKFESRIKEIHNKRLEKNVFYNINSELLPDFCDSPERKDVTWKIAPLPNRLKCRWIDIGDLSPANSAHLADALKSEAQGIQLDFDDGNCPTWKNQIQGMFNLIQVVEGRLNGVPYNINTSPLLIFRPRAWNMVECNVLIRGKEVSGALLDFALIMFHCGKKLYENGCGPFFYLSKMENSFEAKVWNEIFIWTQNELNIPQKTIKACVLIECILAAFEADEILYALKDHSLGLNCGMWDYIASMAEKFGTRKQFLLPDRQKYISSESEFIKAYMKMLINTCHKREAPLTSGMAAAVLTPGADGTCEDNASIIKKVVNAKRKEIISGVDGFLVYDVRLVPYLVDLWKRQCGSHNQIHTITPKISITNLDLLTLPKGGITKNGFSCNIAITVLFVYNWLAGVGHFFYNGNIEDSATAEISRWQIWQSLYHNVTFEDTHQKITYPILEKYALDFFKLAKRTLCRSNYEKKRLKAAWHMSMEIFTRRHPPEFLTSYLYECHKFRTLHNKALIMKSNSKL